MTDSSTPSKSFRWPAVVVAAAAVVGGYIIIATGPQTVPEEKVRPPKIVTTSEVPPRNHRVSVRAHGTVIPVRRVTIEPEVTGPIVRHHPALVPGGFLREEEEMFAIDPSLIQLSLRESAAAVARAEAMLKESKRKQAEANRLALERVIPDTELAAIESQVLIQAAELERLMAGHERTKALLDRHVVRAPFNAVVLEEFVEIGQRVNPGFASATLVGTDEFWVRAVIPVDQLRWIRLPEEGEGGARAEVFFDTGNGEFEHRSGRVVQLLTDMELQGRMARILIKVDDPLGSRLDGDSTPLLLGSYVRVDIDAGELKGVLAIDRTALREGDRIWVVDADGQLQIRDTVVRWRTDETVYVDNALRPGERLIVSALRVALPGMKVKARPAADESSTVAKTESPMP